MNENWLKSLILETETLPETEPLIIPLYPPLPVPATPTLPVRLQPTQPPAVQPGARRTIRTHTVTETETRTRTITETIEEETVPMSQAAAPYPVNHFFHSVGKGEERWINDDDGHDMSAAERERVRRDLAEGRAYLVRRHDLDK